MGKAAAKPKTTTTEDSAQTYFDTFAAKSRFFSATLNMGWRLALTVLIPLIGGVKIDQRFDSSPSYTLVGLMLAATGGTIAVWKSVQEVTAEQAEMELEEKKSKRKAKKV